MKNQKVTAAQIKQDISLQEDLMYELLVRQHDNLVMEVNKLKQEVNKDEQKIYEREQSEYQMSDNVTTFRIKGEYKRQVKTEYFGNLSICGNSFTTNGKM